MEVQLDFLPLCCNSKFFDMHKSIDLFAQCLHAGPCQMSSSSMPSSSIRSCLSEVTRAGSESASLSMMAHHLDCLTHYQNEMEVTWTMDEAVFNFGWSTPLTYQVHSFKSAQCTSEFYCTILSLQHFSFYRVQMTQSP